MDNLTVFQFYGEVHYITHDHFDIFIELVPGTYRVIDGDLYRITNEPLRVE